MNFNFGEVLSRAGQITWKHKNLWLAGIVIGLMGMLPALITLPFSSSFFSFTDPSEMNRQLPAILLVNVLTIFVSLLSIPVYVLGMVIPSLGTLQLERGSETLNFGELVKGTFPYFWRVLGVLLLVWLGMFVVMLPFIGCSIVVGMFTLGFGSLCLLPIFLLLGILVLVMMEQGMAAVVVDNLGVSGALQRAWELVKKDPGVLILISLLIYVASMVAGMVIAVPMLIPMFGYMNNMMQSMGSQPDIQSLQGMFHDMTLWMLVFSPLYAIFQGILLTFMQSVWTLTYMRLVKPQDNAPVPLEANA
jgi:hypothetical protein